MRKLARLAVVAALVALACLPLGCRTAEQYHLTASGHQVLNNGRPFFWLGDTAWLLVRRSPQDVQYYMANRKSKGFTVVQMMAIRVHHHAPFDLLGKPMSNYAGETPFDSLDPVELNEAYWRYVDFIVDTASKQGLTIALATMWGQDACSLFPNPLRNNYEYGRLLGERYRNRSNLIWLVTGEYEKINANWQADKQAISDEQREMIRAIAQGLEEGHQGRNLMTIHPVGTSSDDFHNDAWLDFNMHQTWGHESADVERIRSDYRLTPVKPVLNGEPGYENRPEKPTSSAWKCRYEGYWSVFSGAFGYTYGADCVWQCGGEWYDALEYEGASDMKHLRSLLESRPILSLSPDLSMLLSGAGQVNGELSYRAALRAEDGRCALVYSTRGLPFEVDLSKLTGQEINAWWYSPRDGLLYDEEFTQAQSPFLTLPAKGAHTFVPPASGENQDWVLVLDDAAAGFPQPGTRI